MKFRDKEKNLLVDVFTRTAEYVLSIIILGTIISGRFDLWIFLIGLSVFISLILIALFISSMTKEGE